MASFPIAVLSRPVVLAESARCPLAEFCRPVVFEESA
jgi:hypothetical protein